MQTFLKIFHLRGVGKVSEQRLHNTWGFLYLLGPLKDMFSLVQLCRVSEATVAVLQGTQLSPQQAVKPCVISVVLVL